MTKVRKSLRDYLSKFKPEYPHAYLPSTASLSSSKKWIRRNCKHPKTLSFAIDNKNGGNGDNDVKPADDESATLSDIDRFLFENFKSLYLRDDEDDPNHKRIDDEKKETPKQGPILFDTPQDHLSGSSKFFVAPCLSSSLIEEAVTSVITTSDEASSSSSSISSNTLINDSILNYQKKEKEQVTQTPTAPEDCIAIFTYSTSPCEDFKRSMKEMVEARLRKNEEIDWEFMEELLFCYLRHNDKKSYKYILNAFVDIIVVLRQNPERALPTSAAAQSNTAGGAARNTSTSESERKSAPATRKIVR